MDLKMLVPILGHFEIFRLLD